MSYPTRAKYPDAIYHIFDHAVGEEPLFRGDRDRMAYQYLLGRTVRRHGWRLYAWCLMTTHLHLMFRTPEADLSEGMHRLKTTYAGLYNRWYRRRGAVFRSPFEGPDLVRPSHVQEVIRYIVLNPVYAGVVARPEDWPWSSHRPTVGLDARPRWLDVEGLLELFDTGPGAGVEVYREFVEAGIGMRSMNWRNAVIRPPRRPGQARGVGFGSRSPSRRTRGG